MLIATPSLYAEYICHANNILKVGSHDVMANQSRRQLAAGVVQTRYYNHGMGQKATNTGRLYFEL